LSYIQHSAVNYPFSIVAGVIANGYKKKRLWLEAFVLFGLLSGFG
jgi:hypothetical protein